MSRLNVIRRAAFALAMVLAGAGAAQASVVVAESGCPKAEMRFVVLGDSLADGLWASLHRSYARCTTVETVRLTTVSDGLAKTSANGWLNRYVKAGTNLNTRDSDIVIVQIGANDITTIRNGGSRESFSTPEWDQLYSSRVSQLAQGLNARAASVFWYGLPVVGKSNLEAPYQRISALQQRAARRAGAKWIDIHDLTKFGTGDFAMNGAYQGRLQQLRAGDKVHFTRSGYDFVAAQVLDDLARLIAERNRKAATRNVELQ